MERFAATVLLTKTPWAEPPCRRRVQGERSDRGPGVVGQGPPAGQRILDGQVQCGDRRLPLVCAGPHEAKQALMTDQQLADRFESRELPTW